MSDTPISDSTPHNVAELGMLCRRLERELEMLTADNFRLSKSNRQLREGAEEQKQRIHSLIAERDTARQQADQKVSLREEFRELLGTDDIEQGITAVCDLKQLAAVRLAYIQQLEEQLMDVKNKHSVLVADVVLNEDRAEQIKRLEEAGDALSKIQTYDLIQNFNWRKAKEAKP
jgi:hypothetical protein